MFDTYQEIYTEGPDNIPRAYEFVSGRYEQESGCRGEPQYRIDCRYINYDGEQFGWVEEKFSISQFKGKLKITSLPIYPLIYHSDREKVREDMIRRGRKFESLRGIHYMRYGFKKAGEVETVSFQYFA